MIIAELHWFILDDPIRRFARGHCDNRSPLFFDILVPYPLFSKRI